jgi:hypothetical protein
MNKMQSFISISAWAGKNIVNISIGLILILVFLTNFRHSRYNHPERVIEWDIKSYYAWLPAVFIYNDLSLEFRRAEIEKFGDLIWPIETPTGKHAIITTMAMSVLYSPFFAIAHTVAKLTSWEADGYSRPYRFALTFSALFYLWAGLLFLRGVLRRYFSEYIVAATIIAVTLGTNLFYYSSYEAPLTHAYNFSLIAAFIWLTIRFYDKPSLKYIILGGLLSGFITLIRPVNIIVLVLFFLWDIRSFRDLRERTSFFLNRGHWVLLMAAGFILVWIPQFIYWHWVSGSIFYFTYGEAGGRFFFNNPQIFSILFSVKKGWLVYTPIMLFSLIGIVILIVKKTGPGTAIAIFMILNIYILSSWWNWWFGGGFGLRSFVDSYSILAIPMGAFIAAASRQAKMIRAPLFGILALLLVFNLFQTRQYVNNAIHWWWMNRDAYWETFLKLRPTERYWSLITFPDHDLARQGIYREVQQEPKEPVVSKWKITPTDEELIAWIGTSLREKAGTPDGEDDDRAEMINRQALEMLHDKGREYYEKLWALELIAEEITSSPQMVDYIKKKARENRVPYDTMLLRDAIWLYYNQR